MRLTQRGRVVCFVLTTLLLVFIAAVPPGWWMR